MSPAEALLAQAGAQVRLAQEALADEREGDLARAVLLLEADATRLGALVRSW